MQHAHPDRLTCRRRQAELDADTYLLAQVERLNNRFSNESLLERVQRLIADAQRVEG